MTSSEDDVWKTPQAPDSGAEGESIAAHTYTEQIQLTEADVVRAVRGQYRPSNLIWGILAVLVIGNWIAQGNNLPGTLIVVPLVMMLGVGAFTYYINPILMARRIPKEKMSYTLILSPRTLRTESNQGINEVKWEAIPKVTESKLDFFIQQPSMAVQFHPKRELSSGAIALLSERAKMVSPQAAQARGSRIQTVLIIWLLLVVGALAMYLVVGTPDS